MMDSNQFYLVLKHPVLHTEASLHKENLCLENSRIFFSNLKKPDFPGPLELQKLDQFVLLNLKKCFL